MINNINLNNIREQAESYYRNGDFYCSEAIVKAIKDNFQLPFADDVIALASGFPIGIGCSGCTCGAVSGGVIALGMVFGRSKPKDLKVNKAMKLSKELYDFFLKHHKSTCCRVLTKGMTFGSPDHISQCMKFTGEVTEETAKIIMRELNKK